jgi:hypothetical protein
MSSTLHIDGLLASVGEQELKEYVHPARECREGKWSMENQVDNGGCYEPDTISIILGAIEGTS